MEFHIFDQITQAIDQWMLNKYPKFDNLLIDKIKELERMQNEFKLTLIDHKNDTRNLKKKEVEEFKSEICKFLQKDYPDISSGLIELSKKIDKKIKSYDEKDKKIDLKLKTIVSSSSLCEDVYKMRDEFKEMKCFMDGFSKKLKKVFE